jgi:uncharacterized protein YjbI with pentapeptide repeats
VNFENLTQLAHAARYGYQIADPETGQAQIEVTGLRGKYTIRSLGDRKYKLEGNTSFFGGMRDMLGRGASERAAIRAALNGQVFSSFETGGLREVKAALSRGDDIGQFEGGVLKLAKRTYRIEVIRERQGNASLAIRTSLFNRLFGGRHERDDLARLLSESRTGSGAMSNAQARHIAELNRVFGHSPKDGVGGPTIEQEHHTRSDHSRRGRDLSSVIVGKSTNPADSDFRNSYCDADSAPQFRFGDLSGVSFENAVLPMATFLSSVLKGAVMKDGQFRGAKFMSASFENADLSCADFSPLIVQSSDGRFETNSTIFHNPKNLRLANLAGANLTGVEFFFDYPTMTKEQLLEILQERGAKWKLGDGPKLGGSPIEPGRGPTDNSSGPAHSRQALLDKGVVSMLKQMGLHVGAPMETVNEAYKSLVRHIHPDKGGTNEYMAELNANRDKYCQYMGQYPDRPLTM